MNKFKSRPIFLVSSLPSDESLDKIKPKWIKLDDSLHTDPIKVQEFKESVCIFDDIDVISEKKIREAVYNILKTDSRDRQALQDPLYRDEPPSDERKGHLPDPQGGAYSHLLHAQCGW